MKKIIKHTFEHIATTQAEAEGIVAEAKLKHSVNVVNEVITRKLKSTKDMEIEYFVVKVTVQHVTIKEVLEELA